MSSNGDSAEVLPTPAEIIFEKIRLQAQVTDAAGELAILGSALDEVSFDTGYSMHRLSPVQLGELEAASRGISIKERASQTNRNNGTIDRHRYDLVHRIGAKSLPHAVRLGIVSGKLNIVLDDEPTHLKPKLKQTVLMTSFGMTTSYMANAIGYSESTITDRIRDTKEALGANNKPHMVRRAFEAQAVNIPSIEGNLSERLLEAAKSIRQLSGLAEGLEELALKLSPRAQTEV